MVEPHTRTHDQRRGLRLLFALFAIVVVATEPGLGQQPAIPEPQTATVVGTITDAASDIVGGATVVLQGPAASDQRTISSNDNGFFSFGGLKPGVPYHITVSAKGFTNWSSDAITLRPGQYFELPTVRIRLAVVVTSVTAAATPEQIATQQVEIAEKQRVLGFIPNFYVVYDEHPVPLTPKLKFRLAARTMTDPITLLGSAFVAAIDQAANYPRFGQGWDAYGQRFGASYANGVTDIMIGGAVLPSLLHQDPRYFYKGTGTNKSRTLYALASPFRTMGDNGHWQPNYSGLGGYLASGAIANTYYPESNRGAGLLFRIFGIDVAADMANGVIQEFLLRKLTPSAKNQH
ncbi:MAG: carboxypeptidase regulatory-like domain-containing protein [Silvibacterium sp.]|nr:carboxypeptidase regulatory-like domain-containing protein [Silvibacterium sp.]MBV8437936.1 carboxypeptidase regulatory-like domain-containing protein [Silvibacterium sp.]